MIVANEVFDTSISIGQMAGDCLHVIFQEESISHKDSFLILRLKDIGLRSNDC